MEIKIPEIGESIHEALVASWLKEDGATVAKDDLLCELETDKINVELTAEADGLLRIDVAAGETVAIGTVIGRIEVTVADAAPAREPVAKEPAKKEPARKERTVGESEETPPQRSGKKGSEAEDAGTAKSRDLQGDAGTPAEPAVSPAAARLAREQGVDLAALTGSGRDGRITLEDVQAAVGTGRGGTAAVEAAPEPAPAPVEEGGRPVTRTAMSPLRQRIAARLLEARQQTAMLTTFNEVDMSRVQALRARHQEHFRNKHGVKLGLMSFFVKATVEALREFPTVNARIDGQEIVHHHYHDIGIAVGTERGLVVPVLRDAGELTFGEIEQQIAALVDKAQQRTLTLADLEGGTFTLSNGGVYGSWLSTPILNPPQTGVLGMHAISERPVVRDGEIVIRPVMNLALSYDHRLIDGREAVGFLKLIKEFIEDPSGLFLEL
ncbi:MAG: 2-oxoglutarate dehydrogenase complex dihydrolipoyllysine-residue succinyltransferase [Desulfuromonadales bacterium]|nr:2-oxoglutarate dehydrogenase complex dihydrolipoyllysine-residue succinyltransferase [Desulfuromonadales bacterium]